MNRPCRLDFWYDFASTYSYLSAMRIDALAKAEGMEVRWRPFLLGPIFKDQGLSNSPFALYPVKGRYMWRDMAREAAAAGIAFQRPQHFPQNSLIGARIALLGLDAGWTADFSRALYRAHFAEGADMASASVITAILANLGLDAGATIRDAQGDANKMRLKAVTEEARSKGIFGAPTFITDDGEMFWGNDRLERAIAWACGEQPKGIR